MPLRTSAVVAGGLGLLMLIGVGTIFGESIVALVAPPPGEAGSTVAPGPAGSPKSASTSAAMTAPASASPPSAGGPHATRGDGGGTLPAAAPDGSS